MTFTVGAVLLVMAVVLFILQPVLTGRQASLRREEDEMTEAEATRRVKLLALRDVEYDYATGKLDDADYGRLRRELSAEALAALEEVEREHGRSTAETDELEAEVARVRRGLAAGTTCSGCGRVNPPGSRFCAACGARLVAGTGAEA